MGFGSLLQVEITPLLSTPLEETLQQLGRQQLEETLQQLGTLQLEETLLQLGTLQLEETLQQLGRQQLAETLQVGQARVSRVQPLFLQTSALTRVVARSTTVGANVSTSQRTSTGNDSRLSRPGCRPRGRQVWERKGRGGGVLQMHEGQDPPHHHHHSGHQAVVPL